MTRVGLWVSLLALIGSGAAQAASYQGRAGGWPDPVADSISPTGMNPAWRDASGRVAGPEPTTALLLGVLVALRLVGLSMRRRSSVWVPVRMGCPHRMHTSSKLCANESSNDIV